VKKGAIGAFLFRLRQQQPNYAGLPIVNLLAEQAWESGRRSPEWHKQTPA